MIDYDAIKAKHPLEVILAKRYGVEMKRASGGWLVKCPIHGERHGASFSVNEKKQLWRCHGACQCGGSVLDLVMQMEGMASAREAAEELEGTLLTSPVGQRTAPTKPKPKEQIILERDLPQKPKFYTGERRHFDTVAQARGLHWTSIQLAHDAGCLRFCVASWNAAQSFNCYAILDVENPCNIQLRRMDLDDKGKAKPFPWGPKVMGCKGNWGAWPVGLSAALAHPQATLLLVEGTGDYLAGWDIRAQGEHDVIPVAMFGASNSIAPGALPFFSERKVIIIQQHDEPAAKATARWSQQLQGMTQHLHTWVVPTEGEDLNDYITAGHSPAPIFTPEPEQP